MSPQSSDRETGRNEFERAGEQPALNFFADFWQFQRANKRWWLAPIVVTLLVLAVLALLTMTPAAPFIYTLF
jgi:hypothetical protein